MYYHPRDGAETAQPITPRSYFNSPLTIRIRLKSERTAITNDKTGKRQLACKPGSVWPRFQHPKMQAPERGSHSSGTMFAHRLAQPTRMTGPETGCRRLRAPRHPYSVLLPVGFTLPPLSPEARWALTPPFHPYPASSAALITRRYSKRGGFLSVALSLGSPPPDVIRHRVSVEPGLSSPYRLSALVKRGCPANWQAVHNRDEQ